MTAIARGAAYIGSAECSVRSLCTAHHQQYRISILAGATAPNDHIVIQLRPEPMPRRPTDEGGTAFLLRASSTTAPLLTPPWLERFHDGRTELFRGTVGPWDGPGRLPTSCEQPVGKAPRAEHASIASAAKALNPRRHWWPRNPRAPGRRAANPGRRTRRPWAHREPRRTRGSWLRCRRGATPG